MSLVNTWVHRNGWRLALVTAILLGMGSDVTAQYRYAPSYDYYRSDTVEGTVVGGAFGALTGAIIGGKKDRGEGALIGAGVGALTGNLLGRSKDRADEHRAAVGSAKVAAANRQAAARAVTDYDLLRLTQAGVGDDLIISTMRSRGTRLDLSPDSLIALRDGGVSDRVLIAAQQIGRQPPPAPTRTIVTDPPPSTIIVAPRPPYHCPPCHYHYYRPRARVHYHFRF